MVYACFVAKMSKMAFTRFGGQFQFEKLMLGRLDNSGAGVGALFHSTPHCPYQLATIERDIRSQMEKCAN